MRHNGYKIRAFMPQDKDAALALISQVWEEGRMRHIQDTWDWLFVHNPFIPKDSPCALVAECQGRLLGLSVIFLKT